MAGRRLIARALAPYQWRAQWRDVRQRGAWRGANLSTVLALGILGLSAQIALAVAAMMAFAAGNRASGLALVESGLAGVLAGWIGLPLLVNSIAGGSAGVTVQRLAQHPLSLLELFSVGAVGTLLQPVYWVLLLASAVSLTPLLMSAHPAASIVAGLLYVAAAAQLSWALDLVVGAVMSSRRGREVALTLVALLMFSAIPLYTADFDNEAGRITFTVMGKQLLLIDATGRSGLLAAGQRWMPAAWVSAIAGGAAPAWRIAALLVAVVAGLGLSMLALRRLVLHPPEGMGGLRGRQSAIAAVPWVPPRLGVLAAKELRYLLRTLDALLGFAIALVAAIWIGVQPHHASKVLVLCLPAIALNEMVMPLNVFGLDRGAVDRYRLFPLGGREVLLSKNLAFLLLILAEFAIPVIVGAIRLGVLFSLAALCAGLSACILMMAWGNQTSVRAPAPRAFFNFDSKEQMGGILSLLGVTALWLLPLVVGLVARFGGRVALLLGEMALLAAAVAIYVSSLADAGREFDARAEQMRSRLAG